MKVFVTGGTGFLGSHLVEALLARGDDVVCLVRDPGKVDRVFDKQRPRLVAGNLNDVAALETGAGGADLVFHVAGLIAAVSRADFFNANAEGTRRVARAAAKVAPNLQRFVYVSSQAASGPSRRGEALTESAKPNPLTEYGRSKLAGEEAVRECTFPWTIVRPPVVYGPRDTEVLRMFRTVRMGVAPIFGDGKQELSVIYVEDLVTALLKAAASPKPGATYFAAHRQVLTSRDFVSAIYHAVRGTEPQKSARASGPFLLPIPSMVARGALWMTEKAAQLTGKPTLLTPDKANEFLAEAWVCSSAALERDTGWVAQFDLGTGLSRTAAWYRSHGWL